MNFNNKINELKKHFKLKNKEESIDYGLLLKRKRMEKNKTLEEVASGICSVSYLSRIENNQVEVDDEFLGYLFEQLDLDYERIKKDVRVNILSELCKYYLIDNNIALNKIGNDAYNNDNYSEIERLLIKGLLDLFNNNIDYVEISLNELDNYLGKFSDNEMIIYLYETSLYAYLIKNYLYSYQLLLFLFEMTIENTVIKQLVYNLMIKIFGYFDDDWRFMIVYSELQDKKYALNQPIINLENRLVSLYMTGKNDYEMINEEFRKFYDDYLYDEMDNYLNIKYSYYYIKFLLYHKRFDDALREFNCVNLDSDNVILFNHLLLLIDDHKLEIENLHRLKSVQFRKYDAFSHHYTKYMIARIEGNPDFEYVDYLKNVLLNDSIVDSNTKNAFIYQVLYLELDQQLFKNGKYKEIAKNKLKLI